MSKKYILSDSYDETGINGIKVVANTVNDLKIGIADYVMKDAPTSTEYFEIGVIDLTTNEVRRVAYSDLDNVEENTE